MLRSALSKVMWERRATVFMMGLVLMVGLLFGMASAAFGDNGDNFILGSLKNTATAITKLTGNVSGGPALQVVNNTNAGSRGLQLNVAASKPPIQVNPTAGKATNLNADTVDGQDPSDFFPAGGTLPSGTTLRGNFEIDADADEDTSSTLHSTASNAISFGFALASAPVAHTIDVNETPPPECPGTASAPEAAPGHLCIYESFEENEREDFGSNVYPNTLNTTRYGTGLYTQSRIAGMFFISRGTWAVTAP
jgi:hypothetical protein